MDNKEKRIIPLDDDELVQVSGGSVQELIQDNKVFVSYGMIDKMVDPSDEYDRQALINIWDRIGVKVIFKDGKPNEYIDKDTNMKINHRNVAMFVANRRHMFK